MKRKGFIYEKIVELDNIELAICKASMGKTKRKNVEKINATGYGSDNTIYRLRRSHGC